MISARYAEDFDVADLDEAITLRRRLLSSSPLDEDDRLGVLVVLGHSLQARFERRQRPADLDEAIAALTEAMAYDDPLRLIAAFNLNGSLLLRFLRTRDPGDVDAAVNVARAEVEREADPEMLAALSRALGMRFEIGGVPADLDEAIETGRAAIALTPRDHPDSAGYCGNLAVLISLRAAQTVIRRSWTRRLSGDSRRRSSSAVTARPAGLDLAPIRHRVAGSRHARRPGPCCRSEPRGGRCPGQPDAVAVPLRSQPCLARAVRRDR